MKPHTLHYAKPAPHPAPSAKRAPHHFFPAATLSKRHDADPGFQMHAEDYAFLVLLALVLYALFFR